MLNLIRFIAIVCLISACQRKPYGNFITSKKEIIESKQEQKNEVDKTVISQTMDVQTPIVCDFPLNIETQKVEQVIASTEPDFSAKAIVETTVPTTIKQQESFTKNPKSLMEKPKTNTLAQVSFGMILATIIATFAGILTAVNGVSIIFLALLALILGIVALPKIKKNNQKGKGLAIASIVLSGLYIISVGLLIAAVSSLH